MNFALTHALLATFALTRALYLGEGESTCVLNQRPLPSHVRSTLERESTCVSEKALVY